MSLIVAVEGGEKRLQCTEMYIGMLIIKVHTAIIIRGFLFKKETNTSTPKWAQNARIHCNIKD